MMDRETEVLEMIKSALSSAKPLLGNRKVVLFGSRACGRAKPRSDFDLAVTGAPMPLNDFYTIEGMLEKLPTLYRIDWIDLARADTKFAQRALRQYEVIYG